MKYAKNLVDQVEGLFVEAAKLRVDGEILNYLADLMEDGEYREANVVARKALSDVTAAKALENVIKTDMDLDELDAYILANAK